MTEHFPDATQPAHHSSQQGPSRKEVWKMFDRFHRRYDLANRVISLGRDTAWRRKVAAFAPKKSDLDILDLATGTGDQLFALHKAGLRWRSATGMDMARGMLDVARQKNQKYSTLPIRWIEGDATQLHLHAEQYDFIIMSYGIRNVVDVPATLRGIISALRPGGTVAILEASRPRFAPLAWAHRVFLRLWVQGIGGLISGDPAAFRYLPDTILTFPSGEDFVALMRKAGFAEVKQTPLMLGAVSIYSGTRPHD
jgi:demethylmenaquinone methyltransferase/2-methoxy-6-polyprenyl-1,4-benzoquinol methylase